MFVVYLLFFNRSAVLSGSLRFQPGSDICAAVDLILLPVAQSSATPAPVNVIFTLCRSILTNVAAKMDLMELKFRQCLQG
jgi:hypothetical protein